MVEITILEVHFEDATFDATATANAPLSDLFGDDDEVAVEDDETDSGIDTAGEPGGVSIGKLLLAVAVLGGLAALAARLLNREDIDEMIEVAGEEIDIETEPAEREADD